FTENNFNSSKSKATILLISIIFFCSLFILYTASNFKISFKMSKYGLAYWLFNSRNKRLNWIFSIYLVSIVSGFSILTSSIANLVNEKGKVTGDDLLLYIILLLINNMMLVFISKKVFKALIKKFARYRGETFYYDEEDGQRWYIYHIAEKSTYLLGDSVDPNDAKMFTTIEKSKLLSKKISVNRIPNGLDQTREN
ncbi:hypothetical protein, partial [Paenibacillus ihuae]|uniref:hypothetical protein n=1 Tax=Paenibacillus ihuae TaxID=1232431 RepID=UPI001ADF18AE